MKDMRQPLTGESAGVHEHFNLHIHLDFLDNTYKPIKYVVLERANKRYIAEADKLLEHLVSIGLFKVVEQ